MTQQDTKKEEELKHSTDEMASFCKRKGFVYQNSEIYGGYAGLFDYGPVGVDLKNNLKSELWKHFVHGRDDVAGIDGSIITHPQVWVSSGHAEGFGDILIDCTKCRAKIRADHHITDNLGLQTDGITVEQVDEIVKKENLVCPNCGGDFSKAQKFLLMFTTQVGAAQTKTSTAFLRPETAQVIFTDFKLVQENARMKLPFGIAQTGKAFRNEISPRNFLFRMREFEQFEIEYFVDPKKIGECPYHNEVKDRKLLVWTQKAQNSGADHEEMTMQQLLDTKEVKSPWHTYWLIQLRDWFVKVGCKAENFRLRVHLKEELAHYAAACVDIEYKYPFGWAELHGMADRTTYDLDQHIKHSGKDLAFFDEETKTKIVGHVIEPSQGVDRAFLTIMYDAYNDDKERGNIVLKFDPKLSPVKAAIFPLVNKEGLPEIATEIYKELRQRYNVQYDRSGSVGRRYARQDEIGTPYCITVDFDTLKDNAVTIRDRDTTTQRRVKINELKNIIRDLIEGDVKFESVGEKIANK
ncbi:glycine--tRNA ligase [Candidatus Woesearchaeota archaeon]|nr:glycine--tRNA ligase [Candidatus Woesearchaeota archaeon]